MDPSQRLLPGASVEFVIPGQPLVLPLLGPDDATDPVVARLANGRQVAAATYWVSPRVRTDRAPGWLGPHVEWRVYAQGDARPSDSATGSWITVLDIAKDGAGEYLDVNGARLPVRWIQPPPPRGAPEAGRELPRGVVWDTLHVAKADPTNRWRIELLAERLDLDAGATPPLAHPALEMSARQTLARWRAALARLGASSPPTAARLREALTRLVEVEHGGVPAWPTNERALADLLAALLDPRREGPALAEYADAWMKNLPRATAWIAADNDGDGALCVGVAELSGLPGAASVRGGAAVEMQPVGGATTARLCVPLAPDAGSPGAVNVAMGDWRRTLAVRTDAIPVSPPGATLGPLLPNFTMSEWLAGADPAPEARASTVCLLQRAPSGGWEFYIECEIPPGFEDADSAAVRDWVLIEFAGQDRPTGVRVEWSGGAVDPYPRATKALHADVRREARRWTAFVPASMLEGRSEAHVRIRRVDPRGVESTWPRARPAWDFGPPAYARIDLTAWGGLDDSDATPGVGDDVPIE